MEVEKTKGNEEKKNKSSRIFEKILNKCITELNIPWRILDALKDSGCLVIGDVVQKNEKELITDGLLDKKSVKELKIALEELNLRLGMEVNEHLELSNREKTVREALGRNIDELHLSDEVKQHLKKWCLTTATDLVQIDKDCIRNHDGLGEDAIKEIDKAIGKLNLHYGSKFYLGIDLYKYLKELHEKEQREVFSKKTIDLLELPEEIIIEFENDGIVTISDLMKKISEVSGIEKLNVRQETIDVLKKKHIVSICELWHILLRAYEDLLNRTSKCK